MRRGCRARRAKQGRAAFLPRRFGLALASRCGLGTLWSVPTAFFPNALSVLAQTPRAPLRNTRRVCRRGGPSGIEPTKGPFSSRGPLARRSRHQRGLKSTIFGSATAILLQPACRSNGSAFFLGIAAVAVAAVLSKRWLEPLAGQHCPGTFAAPLIFTNSTDICFPNLLDK